MLAVSVCMQTTLLVRTTSDTYCGIRKPKGAGETTANIHNGDRASQFVMTERRCYFSGTTGRVFDCAYHPVKPNLVCALDEGQVRLFQDDSSCNPAVSWTLGSKLQQSRISCISWNLNGFHLAAGCTDGSVLLWRNNFRCGEQTKKFHRRPILALKWGRWNQNLFASRSRDEGTIQRIILWDAESEELKVYRTYEIETKFVWDFEWISATRLALCTFEGVIYVFHIGRNTPIRILSHVGVCKIAWNSGWNFLVSGSLDGSLKMWSIDNPTQALYQCQLGSKVYCIDCLYLGKGTDKSKSSLIACGLEDGTTFVWNASSDQSWILDGHLDAVFQVLFSPNGRYLATADMEETIIIWLTEDWTSIYQYDKSISIEWGHLSWAPNGRSLAISNSTSQVLVIEFVEGDNEVGLASLGH